jgi:hypothetical protein
MSLAAVCKAARDVLQKVLAVDANSCECGFDGQPDPMAGESYYRIHPLGWNALPQDYDLSEEYTVGVTLTMRLGWVPKDRRGVALWLAYDGLDARAREVVKTIHHNQLLRKASVVYLQGKGGGDTLTPLQLVRIDMPQVRSYDWFTAEAPEEENQSDDAGVSQTIVFGKCQRVQNIEYME